LVISDWERRCIYSVVASSLPIERFLTGWVLVLETISLVLTLGFVIKSSVKEIFRTWRRISWGIKWHGVPALGASQVA
jgi:hypothetical protein